MMIFFGGVWFCFILWSIMRLFKELWEKEKLPGWFTFFGGMLAWFTLLSLIVPVWGVVDLIMRLFTRPERSIGFELGGIVFFIATGLKMVEGHPELLDYGHVKPFIMFSLSFQGYKIKRDDVFVELEKHYVKKVYKEITGKSFPESLAKKMSASFRRDPEKLKKELESLKDKPLKSIHLQDELNGLKNGETVRIVDTFKINVLSRKRFDLYDHIFEMRVSPADKCLFFSVRLPHITPETKLNTNRMFQLKQEVYDLLQAVNSEAVLRPYSAYFEKIKLMCHRDNPASLGQHIRDHFLSVEIPTSELQKRAGEYFNVNTLNIIATVRFQSEST